MELAIISKAQQARPNDSGHTDDFLPQLSRASIEVMATLRFSSSGTSSRGSGSASVRVDFRLLTYSPSARSKSQVVV